MLSYRIFKSFYTLIVITKEKNMILYLKVNWPAIEISDLCWTEITQTV